MARPAKYTTIGRFLRRNHPQLLEQAYESTAKLFNKLEPVIEKIGHERVGRWISGPEHFTKKAIFDCRMCGQCVLHSTGMTCPMTCPKNLRNGPCGGVRPDGNCEVFPEMRCAWVEAFEGSQKMPSYGTDMMHLNPPVNRQLEGQSAWITQMTGVDKQTPEGWVDLESVVVVPEFEYPTL